MSAKFPNLKNVSSIAGTRFFSDVGNTAGDLNVLSMTLRKLFLLSYFIQHSLLDSQVMVRLLVLSKYVLNLVEN